LWALCWAIVPRAKRDRYYAAHGLAVGSTAGKAADMTGGRQAAQIRQA